MRYILKGPVLFSFLLVSTELKRKREKMVSKFLVHERLVFCQRINSFLLKICEKSHTD